MFEVWWYIRLNSFFRGVLTAFGRSAFWCDRKAFFQPWLCKCCYGLRLKINVLLIRILFGVRLELKGFDMKMNAGRWRCKF